MVQHDLRVGESLGQVDDVHELGLQQPGIERQAEWGELSETHAEGLVIQQPGWRQRQPAQDRSVGVPGCHVPDAAEPAVARGELRLKHVADSASEAQLGEADNAGRHPDRAVQPARAHSGDAVDELGFPDRRHLFAGVGPVHRMALSEYGSPHVVFTAHIGQEVLEQVTGPAQVLPLDASQIRVGQRATLPNGTADPP
jgi:hypothetical protein